MTPAALRRFTCKDLAQMARKQGVPGWHAMRKDQLVRALIKSAKAKARNNRNLGNNRDNSRRSATSARAKAAAKRTQGPSSGAPSKATDRKGRTLANSADSRVQRSISQLRSKLERIKNLASAARDGAVKDRLVLMVRDPYWLHAYWEVTCRSIDRAQAALGQHWHTARPVLRVLKIDADGALTVLRTIVIHGGVNNWYVDVRDPPSQYQLEIGYLADNKAFHRLATSNSVTTPPSGVTEASEETWNDLAENADRIFALSGGYSARGGSQELQELLEERLGRPMGSPLQTRFGQGAARALAKSDEFQLAVDADMVVYGATRHDAHVTLQGEPVKLSADGTFSVRLTMPDRRQVIPVVASSQDGAEQRTISIAIERNTKVMEPVYREPGH